jgi:FtsH-binding integral membrane protein
MPRNNSRSPTCDNYFGKVFAHLGGALALAAVSAETLTLEEQLERATGSKLLTLLLSIAIAIALIIGIFKTAPGSPQKYAFFIAFAIWIGQTLKPLVDSLQARASLGRILALTTGVFLGMMAIGFYDRQNLLGFGPYLFAGLIGLIIVQLIIYALASPAEKKTAMNWLRFIGIALFAAYTAYDVQLVKAGAAGCRAARAAGRAPDYPQESLGLFLDFVNLFSRIGGGNSD